MTKRSDRGEMQGRQRHAEGEHGPATRARIREEVREPSPEQGEPGGGAEGAEGGAASAAPGGGRHRLHEHRVQHDPADVQSEKNRAAREPGHHGRDR